MSATRSKLIALATAFAFVSVAASLSSGQCVKKCKQIAAESARCQLESADLKIMRSRFILRENTHFCQSVIFVDFLLDRLDGRWVA